MKKIRIGLLGFGTVGSGTAKILLENRDVIESRLGAFLKLKRIAVRDLETDRGVAVDKSILTTDANVDIDAPDMTALAYIHYACHYLLVKEGSKGPIPTIGELKKLIEKIK